jgi:prepilin signal peptidase PulO-like enzyme (type II secretory pathway)
MNIPEVLSISLFSLFSVAIALADLNRGEVPRAAFIAAFPVFFALRVGWGSFPLGEALAGLFAGLVVFLLARSISDGKLGLADVWYSAFIGMVLGPRLWYGAAGLACVGGMALLLVTGRSRIPFIPLLAAGSIAMAISNGWWR